MGLIEVRSKLRAQYLSKQWQLHQWRKIVEDGGFEIGMLPDLELADGRLWLVSEQNDSDVSHPLLHVSGLQYYMLAPAR
jgi:hypothetical protein